MAKLHASPTKLPSDAQWDQLCELGVVGVLCNSIVHLEQANVGRLPPDALIEVVVAANFFT